LGGSDPRATPPADDEVEVSLLGPGYGECIVMHFTRGEWVIVDSCIDISTRRPVALDYLDQIHVDVAKDVRLVVATHWHDDHIRGLAEIVRAAGKARLVHSMTLRSDEFTTLVKLVEPKMMLRSSGVREFAEILEILKNHTPAGFAIADRRLWLPAGPVSRSVWALSPSDRSVQLALEGLAAVLTDTDLPNTRVPDIRPNHTSVVLWCEIADLFVLLGADLEETSDPNTGWRAIITSTTRPSGKATVFKVPHHGSVTAHNADVWTQMLDDPIALVTPFARGIVKLPTTGDRTRIRPLARESYLTQLSDRGSTAWDPAVSEVLAESTLSVEDAEPPPGHVRLRRTVGEGAWRVEVFGGAEEL
jgi:Metallo-beta-lactamase superfamily